MNLLKSTCHKKLGGFCLCMSLLGFFLLENPVWKTWNSSSVTIQGNGTIKTIVVIKHLGKEVKRLEALLCYDY